MPRRLSFPDAFGIILSRTGRGWNRRALRSSRSSASIQSPKRMEFGLTPSTPADRAPRLFRTRSHATRRKAGSDTRLYRSLNRQGCRSPTGAASPASAVPGTRPRRGRATDRRCSPTDSCHCPGVAADSLGPFGFPVLGLLRTLRPIPRPSADSGRARHRTGCAVERAISDGSHVHRVLLDGVGAQLFPCNLVTSTPQSFLVTSWSAHTTDFGGSP